MIGVFQKYSYAFHQYSLEGYWSPPSHLSSGLQKWQARKQMEKEQHMTGIDLTMETQHKANGLSTEQFKFLKTRHLARRRWVAECRRRQGCTSIGVAAVIQGRLLLLKIFSKSCWASRSPWAAATLRSFSTSLKDMKPSSRKSRRKS